MMFRKISMIVMVLALAAPGLAFANEGGGSDAPPVADPTKKPVFYLKYIDMTISREKFINKKELTISEDSWAKAFSVAFLPQKVEEKSAKEGTQIITVSFWDFELSWPTTPGGVKLPLPSSGPPANDHQGPAMDDLPGPAANQLSTPTFSDAVFECSPDGYPRYNAHTCKVDLGEGGKTGVIANTDENMPWKMRQDMIDAYIAKTEGKKNGPDSVVDDLSGFVIIS
ncbi:MAG TPA: hypothetical protein QGH84_01925 [Rhodospirillales bacterium]|jgi:hypothetical protein|nr:hypothetical protein [Rhodospirillales bacterium]